MDEPRLFFDEENPRSKTDQFQPLAQRMRPRALDEIAGQQHLLSNSSALAIAIQTDQPISAIFWGPPGSGKTSLASVIASMTKARFLSLSAVTSGTKELRKLIGEAEALILQQHRRTIIFIDEIHRFNKAQQDVLLPAVESGTIALIGATTENPYFEINAPLLSRMKIFQFKHLSEENIRSVLLSAIDDQERGIRIKPIEFSNDAIDHIANIANGDARNALTTLELAAAITGPRATVTKETAAEAAQERLLSYDKDGDQHYDIVSAFIKSMRGSAPNAALYWLVRMLEAGEDPRFIARRMVIFASEDIGNADSHALTVAVAVAQAVDFVGLPEAEINLTHGVLYLATAPKDNAVIRALSAARQDVKNNLSFEVPRHLRSTGYKGAKDLGHGEGYIYTHNNPGAHQEFLPPEAGHPKYYEPADNSRKTSLRSNEEDKKH